MKVIVAFVGACLLTLSVMTSSAFAASAYADVPADHWAYNALDYLSERGVLEGYPDGFFKGDRTLTRYEFAQAIARMLDSINQNGSSDDIMVQANALRAEFSDQLADLGNAVNMLGEQVNGLDGRVSDLEMGVADNSSKIEALGDRINGWKPSADWKGEFRYRGQYETRDDTDRFRQRIRFRLGYNKEINDTTMVAFRLSTETGNTVNDANRTLGQTPGGTTADIFLDRAYVKWSPTWFGTYSECEEDCISRLDIYAGIFPNITYDPHEMVLDDEVNFQGLGAVYHFNRDFQVLASTSIVTERNAGEFSDDVTICAIEARHKNLLVCGLDAWIGSYCFGNESRLPDSYFADNGLRGFDFNNNGTVGDSGDRMSVDYSLVKGGLQYTFPCVWNKPLAVWGEYVVNTASDADERIALVNQFINPDIIYEETDDTGIGYGVQWGEKPAATGEWMWYASYKEIGANAAIDGLADADSGGANTNSLELGAQYAFLENSVVGITYFLNKMNNAFGFNIVPEKADQTIVQLDWTFKF